MTSARRASVPELSLDDLSELMGTNISKENYFPAEIGKLTDLTHLRLNGNQLTALPPEIGNLTNLTELYVNDNQLTALPPEIGNLTNLNDTAYDFLETLYQ